NGHPDDMIGRYSRQVRYKEPLLLFHQGQDGKLKNISSEGGTAFEKSFAARGLAVGDYDNDGALDVLIATNGGPPVLLKNNAAKGNNWLGLRLEGVTCNRDAIGARILWKAGGKLRQRLKNNGGSYLSSHDLRQVLGVFVPSSTSKDHQGVPRKVHGHRYLVIFSHMSPILCVSKIPPEVARSGWILLTACFSHSTWNGSFR